LCGAIDTHARVNCWERPFRFGMSGSHCLLLSLHLGACPYLCDIVTRSALPGSDSCQPSLGWWKVGWQRYVRIMLQPCVTPIRRCEDPVVWEKACHNHVCICLPDTYETVCWPHKTSAQDAIPAQQPKVFGVGVLVQYMTKVYVRKKGLS
jgi:hypothetical protein